MTIDWFQDNWKHRVILKNGDELFPEKIELSSAARDKDGNAYPALFCQWRSRDKIQSFGGTMRWIPWSEVREVRSVNGQV